MSKGRIGGKILSMFMVCFLALAMMLSVGTEVFAASSPLEQLCNYVGAGQYQLEAQAGTTIYATGGSGVGNKDSTLSKKMYDKQGGGYYLYGDLVDSAQNGTGHKINETKFNELKIGEKSELVKDIVRFCNLIAEDQASKYDNGETNQTKDVNTYITSDTVTDYLSLLQNVEGINATLIESTMSEVKTDLTGANMILKPFNGVVSTVLGVLTILIMSLLMITMANDIAYIVIPAYQLFLDGDSDGGQGGQGGATKGMARIVSQEARNAVKAAENDGGGGGQTGSQNKLAISVYFKHRWKSLFIIGLCLLYLIGGQIWSFISWLLNMLSGFVGF